MRKPLGIAIAFHVSLRSFLINNPWSCAWLGLEFEVVNGIWTTVGCPERHTDAELKLGMPTSVVVLFSHVKWCLVF